MHTSFTKEDKRTHYALELSAANIGERVSVLGWAQRQRDLGSLIFIDLRDRDVYKRQVPKDLAEEYVKKDLYYNAYENEKTHDAYATMIANGKCTLLLLTPELYAEAKEAGALEPLENILGLSLIHI